jgi:syntaxin 7
MEGYSNSYQNGSASKEAEFQRLAQSIGTNIQKMIQNVSSMQRMLTQIGTSQDNQHLQNQMHQIQHYTNQLAKDTSKQLKELNEFNTDRAVDPRQWKLQREKFTSDFTRALDTFQRAQRQAAQKEKDVIRKFKTQPGFGAPDQNLIDIEGGAAAQTRTQVMLEEEQNVEMLQERERAVRQLEADIGDVNQIFKDLAAMVHDQGELVDSIEANVESSSVRVEEGTQQLLQAERYQNKARRKKMILALIGLIILVILIIIIAYSAKN